MDNELSAFESKFRRLAELRMDRDIAKEADKAAETAYREYEAELLETIEGSALKGSVEFDFGEELGTIRFQPRGTIYGRIVDKRAALESLAEEHMEEEMTSPKIEARRLNEYVRNCLEDGRELPDGIGYYERKYFAISHKG